MAIKIGQTGFIGKRTISKNATPIDEIVKVNIECWVYQERF